MTARGTCDIPPIDALDEATVGATNWAPFVVVPVNWTAAGIQPNSDFSPPTRQIWPRRGS